MIRNGVVVQDISAPAFGLSRFNGKYLGINSFWTNPLAEINDIYCKKISEEVFHKKNHDGCYTLLEFISDPNLLFNYISKCKELNIEVRILQVESDYEHEKCEYNFPIVKFIGYEFCEIPFDSQVITDFDWYTPFHQFYKYLNEYGLFSSFEYATLFKSAYESEFQSGKIGDGEIDTFICKVSEIDVDAFITSYCDLV